MKTNGKPIRVRLLVLGFTLTISLAASSAQQVSVPPPPEPDLSNLEPVVREQLDLARKVLQSSIDEGVPPQDLGEGFGYLAQLYHAYGLRSAARQAYLSALTLSPQDFRWLYLAGVLDLESGLLDEGEWKLREAIARRPQETAALCQLAQVKLQQNLQDEASLLFEQVIEAEPNNAFAHFGLGQIALSNQNFSRAIDHFQTALTATPDANRIHYSLGLAYRGIGNLERAQQELARAGTVGVRVSHPLTEAFDQLKKGVVVFTLAGKKAYEAGRYQEALENFQKAVDADPEDMGASTNLGVALARSGDTAAAIRQFRLAIEKGSESIPTYFNLASLLAQAGEHAEVISLLEFIFERDPGDREMRLLMANSLQALGRWEDSLTHLSRAADLNPADEVTRLREIDTLLRLERFSQAALRLTRANEFYPNDGITAHTLARLLATSPNLTVRNGQKAIRLGRLVFTAQPTLLHGETVALAYAEAGDCAQALAWQKNILEEAKRREAAEWVERLEQRLPDFEQSPCRP